MRIDREGMIDDVITYDTWHHLCQKYLLTLIITNLWWHKMCKKDVVFPPIILIVAYITMAYQNLWGNIWCYKFNSSNSARYLKFYCWKVESSRVELRIDREGMIDDVITYITWHHLCQKYLLTLIITNLWWHKMCKKDVVFPPITLIVAYITMAYQNL